MKEEMQTTGRTERSHEGEVCEVSGQKPCCVLSWLSGYITFSSLYAFPFLINYIGSLAHWKKPPLTSTETLDLSCHLTGHQAQMLSGQEK